MINTELRDRIKLLTMGAVMHASSFDTTDGRLAVLHIDETLDALTTILARLLVGSGEARTARDSRRLADEIGQQLRRNIAIAQAEFAERGNPFATITPSRTEH